jgi:hypothetical protein
MALTKTTRFDVSKFLANAREAREEAVEFFAANGGTQYVANIRDAYRFVMDDSHNITVFTETPNTAEDLRNELVTASIAAGQYGASRKQIEHIVALSAEKGDFARTGYASLTARQASRLIDDLKKEA